MIVSYETKIISIFSRVVGFLSSFENMTQPSTVHLLTSSVLSGLKKNRTESGRANAFRASQMYVGDRKERMPKNNQAGQCPNISF